MGSILYMHELPPVGGDTLFASMYAAYDGLSDDLNGSSRSAPRSTRASTCTAAATG
jgi:Probable taurine catabolism dioxygenase